MNEEHTAEKAAGLRALRFARAQAVTERARGRSDEERGWLDMCALLEPSGNTPLGEIVAYRWTRTDGQVFVIDPQEVEIVRPLPPGSTEATS